MRARSRPWSLIASVLMALLLLAPVAAQESTPVTEAPTGMLARVRVDALPSPDAEVWFMRFMLDPGGSLPLDVQIGPTVIVVETGELTLVTDQPVELDGSLPMAAPAADGGTHETIATAGQVAYVREDTALAVRNDGAAPVSALALLTFSGERETEAMSQQSSGTPVEPVGMTQMPIGLTAAEFPEGPGTITIERVRLEPDATARTDVPSGAIAGGVEQGSVTITLASGNGFVWPRLMKPVGPQGDAQGPRRTEVGAGDSGDLMATDGFGFWDAGVDWQAGSDGATILQARIEPGQPEATPAPAG